MDLLFGSFQGSGHLVEEYGDSKRPGPPMYFIPSTIHSMPHICIYVLLAIYVYIYMRYTQICICDIHCIPDIYIHTVYIYTICTTYIVYHVYIYIYTCIYIYRDYH